MNHKVLGSATEGVHLKMLKMNICSAYAGPKTFYPAECMKLVGEQKKFTPQDTVMDKEDKPRMAPGGKAQGIIALAEKATNTEVEPPVIKDGDGDRVEDMEHEAVVAPVVVPVIAEKSGKVQIEVYWRAFWYVHFHQLYVRIQD